MLIHGARIEKRYLAGCPIVHWGCSVGVNHAPLVACGSLQSNLKIICAYVGTSLPGVTINPPISWPLFGWCLRWQRGSLRCLVLWSGTVVVLLVPLIIVKPIRALIKVCLLQIITAICFIVNISFEWLSLYFARDWSLRRACFAKLLAHLRLSLSRLPIVLLLIDLRFIHLYYNYTGIL